MFYGSPESLEFTNIYFYSVLFYALKASNKIAIERKETFDNFEKSKYATGEFFDKYLGSDSYEPTFEKVKEIFKNSTVKIPTKKDWVFIIRIYKLFHQQVLFLILITRLQAFIQLRLKLK